MKTNKPRDSEELGKGTRRIGKKKKRIILFHKIGMRSLGKISIVESGS